MDTARSAAESRVRPSAFGCITVPFLLIALVPLAWGARTQWMRGALLRGGETVPGTVTEVRYVPGNSSLARQSSRGGQARGSSPMVTFTTRTGRPMACVGSVNRYPEPWKAGDVVDVVYDPADPRRADLRSELTGWLLRFVIWCGVALLPLAIAAAPVILALRRHR